MIFELTYNIIYVNPRQNVANSCITTLLRNEESNNTDALFISHLQLYRFCNTFDIFSPTGRLVNVTSVKGRIYFPCTSAYGITKHGIETFSDSLRVEMARFGVKVSLVEPGDFSTCTAIVKGENVRGQNVLIICYCIVNGRLCSWETLRSRDVHVSINVSPVSYWQRFILRGLA